MKPGKKLILSIFPGIDLFGKAFEDEGFCVVRGPDLIFGGDIRSFNPPPGIFYGVIGGSPCQDFSKARRTAPTGKGLEMLEEFKRVTIAAAPEWYILENVPETPNLKIPEYHHQRIDLNALECGSSQRRLRHFQWGSRYDYTLIVERITPPPKPHKPPCLASEGTKQERRSFSDFCEDMDLPREFKLPGWSNAFKYAAVGNGVPLKMGKTIARAVKNLRFKYWEVNICACGCGRLLKGRKKSASASCRKRLQRQKARARVGQNIQL